MALSPVLTKYRVYRRGAVLALIAIFVSPGQVLAFEADLPNQPAKKLVVRVRLQGTELPDYSFRATGSVIAFPSIETTSGDWQRSKRLAYHAPNLASPMTMEGEASYYSRAGCLGCSESLTMANGQPLDDTALTMAIGADKKHLVGHSATVTSLATGKSVNVLITDTGGFYHDKYGNRVADLTIATKTAIGMKGGVGKVKVEVH